MTGRPQHRERRPTSLKRVAERVKLCPRCGSTNLTFLLYYPSSTSRCLGCSYHGGFIVENSKLAEATQEKISSKTVKADRGI